MELVEPFKSAQHYIIWVGSSGKAVIRGEPVWYKWVKQGWFSKVLFVWRPDLKTWRPSSWQEIPLHLAQQDRAIKIKEKDRLRLQSENSQLDSEDAAWEREQQEFIKQRAIEREYRYKRDKERAEFLRNNQTDKLLSAFIKRNRHN